MDMNKIAEFIRKQKVAFICSIDENGFPNVKAMLKPRRPEAVLFFNKHVFHESKAVYE